MLHNAPTLNKLMDKMVAKPEIGPIANKAYYDISEDVIVIKFKNDTTFSLPPHKIEGLADVNEIELNHISLSNDGSCIHWPNLNLSLNIRALLLGDFTQFDYQV